MEKLEALLDWGGTRKDVACLVLGGAALLASLFDWLPLPFDPAWIAIVLCGVPIVLEAVIGLVTAFDIKADVLVSLALIASVCIGEDFAAGEVAFIMQLGGLLEDLTVASPPAPPGCSPRQGRRWSRRRRSRWATCSRCAPERPSRWMGSSPAARPPSTRR